jgi:hypothetical protein
MTFRDCEIKKAVAVDAVVVAGLKVADGVRFPQMVQIYSVGYVHL